MKRSLILSVFLGWRKPLALAYLTCQWQCWVFAMVGVSLNEKEIWLLKIATAPVLKNSFKPCGRLSVSGLDTISFCLTSTASHYLSSKMGRFTCNFRAHVFDKHHRVFFTVRLQACLFFLLKLFMSERYMMLPRPLKHKKENYIFMHCIFFYFKKLPFSNDSLLLMVSLSCTDPKACTCTTSDWMKPTREGCHSFHSQEMRIKRPSFQLWWLITSKAPILLS